MIIFPTPTSVGEQFSSGGKTWQWNGFAWDSIANASAIGATGATGVTDFTNYLASVGQSSTVIETIERNSAVASTAPNAGILFLMMITPIVNTTITKLSVYVASASFGTTLFRMGVYSFNEGTNTATLLASTDNSPTATQSIQLVELPLTSPTSITLSAGTRYAFGFIGVGHTLAPTLTSASIVSTLSALPPVMSRSVPGQTNLPATVVATSSPGARFWIRGS
jgi:hypothetical protein